MNSLLINLCKMFVFIDLFVTQCFGININTFPLIPPNYTVYFEPYIMIIRYSCYVDEPLPYDLMMRWYIKTGDNVEYVKDIPNNEYIEVWLMMRDIFHDSYLFCAVIPRSQANKIGPVNILYQTNEVHLLAYTIAKDGNDYYEDQPENIMDEPNELKNVNITNPEIGLLRKYDFKRNRGHSTWVLFGSNLASVFLVLSILGIIYYINKRRASTAEQATLNVQFNRDSEYAYIPIDILPLYETKALAAENKKHNNRLAPPLPKRTTCA